MTAENNLLTQSEAIGRVCPVMIATVNEYPSSGSGAQLAQATSVVRSYTYSYCRAAGCAMWVWSADPTRGYCGLRGKLVVP